MSTKNSGIGIIGFGRMGSNLARRLRDCGRGVVAVYDTDSGAAASLDV